jgi:hypothetical protein
VQRGTKIKSKSKAAASTQNGHEEEEDFGVLICREYQLRIAEAAAALLLLPK